MTNDEKRQQKALLLLEAQEADDELSHLREKLLWISDRFQAVSKALHTFELNGYAPPGLFADPLTEGAMNFQSLKSLMEEFTAVRARVADLDKRKAALGLK